MLSSRSFLLPTKVQFLHLATNWKHWKPSMHSSFLCSGMIAALVGDGCPLHLTPLATSAGNPRTAISRSPCSLSFFRAWQTRRSQHSHPAPVAEEDTQTPVLLSSRHLLPELIAFPRGSQKFDTPAPEQVLLEPARQERSSISPAQCSWSTTRGKTTCSGATKPCNSFPFTHECAETLGKPLAWLGKTVWRLWRRDYLEVTIQIVIRGCVLMHNAI